MIEPRETNKLFQATGNTIRHGVVYAVGLVLGQLSGVLLLALFTRHLTHGDLGRYTLIVSTSAWMSMVAALGVGTAVFRSYFGPGSDAQKRIVLGTATWLNVIGAALLVAVTVAFGTPAGLWLFPDAEQPRKLVLTAAIIAAVTVLRTVPLVTLRVQQKSGTFVFLNLMLLLVKLTGVFWLVAVRDLGLGGALLGEIVSGILAVVIGFLLTYRHICWKFDQAVAIAMLKFGLPFIPINAAGLVIVNGSLFVMNHFHGPQMVAIYSVAYKVANLISSLLVSPFKLIWSSTVFQIRAETYARKYYSVVGSYYLLVLAIAGTGLALLTPVLITYGLSEGYVGSIVVAPILILALTVFGSQEVLNVGMILNGKSGLQALIFGLAALVHVVLNLLFVPSYGLGAAALSTLISYFVVAGVTGFLSSRYLKVAYEWGRIIRTVAFCAVMVLAFYWFTGSSEIWSASSLLVTWTVAWGIVWLLGVLLVSRLVPGDLLALGNYVRKSRKGRGVNTPT